MIWWKHPRFPSGNVTLYIEKINLTELIKQAWGEFYEKFEEKNLRVVDGFGNEPVFIEADSRRTWRIMENLFSNVYKYTLPGTRVYLDKDMDLDTMTVSVILKNISAQPLNIKPEELTERFIRGDESRTTEGSGLGLSIAKSLTELQNGKLEISMDGDLFKVKISFRICSEAK